MMRLMGRAIILSSTKAMKKPRKETQTMEMTEEIVPAELSRRIDIPRSQIQGSKTCHGWQMDEPSTEKA